MNTNIDKTETARRELVTAINSNPDPRTELVAKHGADNVWDTSELQAAFTVEGFMAPFCVVVRKSDGARGMVTFQHSPRFYFDFSNK